MDQTWIPILVILVSYQQFASGVNEPVTLKEGSDYEIKCKPEVVGTMIVWFRVSDKSGMEFIGSFSNTGHQKSLQPSYSSIYSDRMSGDYFYLKLKAFSKDRDSGLYNCASLYKGNELKFGEVTRLRGEEQTEVIGARPTHASTRAPSTTAPTKCACEGRNFPGERRFSMFCAPIILGPLAGGCGLLFLLLLITILYCNRIRTRRCPHHYKRKQRPVPPQKQMMTNTPV